ncbi:MAG: hypothetical protein JNG84_01545, partial [Archangium sp.]|nr:hypothetical protein [Archangium sp.]
TSPFTDDVTLYLSLAARARMFKARCSAEMKDKGRWVLTFNEVAPDDLQLLGSTLIGEYGLLALPQLERRFAKYTALDAQLLR